MVKALYELFKKVWDEEAVPSKWNESRVLLLHKGGNMSKQLLQNYRPISLGNTVGKIFSYVLNERVKVISDRYVMIGEEQNGFRKDRRGEDNLYIIRELIDKNQKEKGTLYLAFLDIEKAYDKVNRHTLIQVLTSLGFHSKLCNIIKSMYTNTRARYIFGDIETNWVKLEKGVRQGCVLSPLLFSLYTEELAARIRNTGYGVRIGDSRLGVLIYADDVVLIADEEATLQGMLNVVASFGNEFSLSFNSKKCGVLIVNKPEMGLENFRVGNVAINRVREYTYLGVVFNEMGTSKAKVERLFRANQWLGRLGSITNFRSNKYEVVRGAWKGVAVPGILYAMDTMNWSLEEMKKIEVIQNKIGRLGLGANRLVGVEAIRGDMGWSSFEERLLIKGKLKFKVRLENMDGNRWARKIYIETGTKSKFSMDCVRVANKCGFSRKWVIHEDSNVREWRLDVQEEDGANFDENKWKRVINRKVQAYGLAKWRNGIENKVSLGSYAIKPQPKMEFFYDGNWASILLFKV